MIYVVGFLAQIFFSARILLQWILSERAKKVISPAIFWQLSILGSYLLFIYGWLRDDFAIIFGQIISYYIYIWNLNKKHQWKWLPLVLRTVLLLTPVAAIIYMIEDASAFVDQFFRNEKIPLWLLLYGSMGQIIFTLRFVYQWIYSKRKDESLLPLGFWVISLFGSLIIVSYAIYRHDPVLILGQSTGLLAYGRNIWLSRKGSC
ncbi:MULTISPECIES: lipid-A-disaccharide synthase N-terminal domain-containing protein [Butyricimonas]|uniref:Lipid-A-disaccharide synthase N-terminal domain-containing protein n=1 Tax=Butyricimonas hominis TaxID=2763032 RepID=A0ABR7CWK7_9BACT|nr:MULTISPECIES: lipid-A-disaccharide synthase N-terminal domain-containing protein [Butyricimonas]MBC5620053.1 lipid-A-disaccharide synthase N-terminal domain-containing protein [Butyricimonas hominis]MCB6973646.1 lipid-A-disaccharide synthase N-terminal domain-containing protein [Butyricimonas synergistica]MCG4520457.1 lipid-A-disaccharide synthase N-terminal domain-containing protein [Butyricimonas sp. DFI.6.44]